MTQTGQAPDGARIHVTGAGLRVRGGREALRDVTLDIAPRQLTGIAGGSGAGKSLLLELLAGLRLPSTGLVRHDGQEPARAAIPSGFVPQDDIVHRGLGLRRSLEYAARLRGADPRIVEGVLLELGLADRADQSVATLSGGERKRAGIAVELLTRPRVLFLDEPTSGLDPATGERLMDTLGELAATGVTVVLTTHSPADLARCDLVAFLTPDGEFAGSGTPDQMLRRFDARTFTEVYAAVAVNSTEPAELPATTPPADPDGPSSATTPMVSATPATAGHPSATSVEGPAPRETDASQREGAERGKQAGRSRLGPGAVGQWLLLTRRGGELLVRDRLSAAIMVGSPLMIVAMFALLFRPGVFDPGLPSPSSTAMVLFWIAFGAFFFGLAYGLLQICGELGVVRRERLTTLRLGPYLASKVTLLLPVLALADALLLLVLRAGDRLPDAGLDVYGSLFVTTALASAAGLTLGLLTSAAVSDPGQAALMLPLLCFPQVLFSGAFVPVPLMAGAGQWLSVAMTNRWAFEALGAGADLEGLWARGASPLGPPLLASYGDSFAHAPWTRWLILVGFSVFFVLVAGWLLNRRCPTVRRPLVSRRQQVSRGARPSAEGTRSR
ncbi:ATP-binding cassette domain-containing protein [Streptomyces albipurpureus]|uniref:ATP-binding cassette domain-containing protein n=1 Tax=Streptomyces albipurpureus TaxID=2897419 RepID=A0ABT0UMG7_9ACTN|nr:ATP-binding cassette domain-containing protein [Streptomyces sp. CWNU-1]MCM2389824.1 ATP-binding cassette domain-containing protein [Streptomyces sp. CWNU-1]